MREKEGFRVQLEQLNKAFPDKDLLSVADVAAFGGMCKKTVMRRYANAGWEGQGSGKRITRANLARAMS